MSVRNLDALFNPKSVAVIGASNRPGSVGSVVMKNLLAGGFAGPVMPVNPTSQAVSGVLTYPDVSKLPVPADLAVIAVPPKAVPGVINELGSQGTRAAVVLTAGLNSNTNAAGQTLQAEMTEIARKYQLRILGPNCLGMIVPGIGLNASFAHVDCLPGRIAFVSQSGGLATAVLDYAKSYGIGLSHFLSLGDICDVDFADTMDYLGSDPEVSAILLYIESIVDARAFMSAGRAAARNKPVVVVKSGRFEEGAKAAASHTGALAGADDIYDAAFRRAGMLRVFAIDELFDAVQTLARSKPLKGDRLAVLTNGGGPAVLAVDALIEQGGRLAELSESTIKALNEKMPPTWSHANPVDIIGDANGERYSQALKVLLKDNQVDAVMVMHVPTAVASVTETAAATIECCKSATRNVLTSWMGQDTVREPRRMFSDAGLPTFFTPDRAVRGFMHMVKFNRNQELLMQTPDSVPEEFTPATATARLVIQSAMASGRDMLTEAEAKAVLAAYGIPIVETQIASSPVSAVTVADSIGYPVAIKILSQDITHKSDVGGVALNLENGEEVLAAAKAMNERIARLMPEAHLGGFTVQHMARRPGAKELIVGVSCDHVFGPTIMFGQGGKAVEVIADSSVGLPPLNMALARAQVERTRIAKLLKGYRDEAPADIDAICLTLIQVSQLITDLPEIVELDINPLFADAKGVLALDARIGVAPATTTGPARLAIRPYPKELEEKVNLKEGRPIVVRPIRPEDEPAHHVFIGKLSPEDIRSRFFGLVRELPHSQMARLTQIDYDREMAFVATGLDDRNMPETLGVARAVLDIVDRSAEFAIVVRSDLKGQGLGRTLMNKLMAYAKQRGMTVMTGQVLKDNVAMIAMCERLGFVKHDIKDDDCVEVRLDLTQAG
ncbi:MAG: bifunctional acetate--CoA ligase family protein/GNAT family N-acetyltransferase [Armatimonadetes bacterium]|nr:bifunctional acetate--CoA ligase family protein/GNAT family N-acetyltransferase [Armatimonadota bacterium]